MEIYTVNIRNGISNEILSSILQYIEPSQRDRINRFRRPEDAARTLVGHMLMKTMASRHLKCGHSNLNFGVNPYGKPFIRGIENFYFNLSHSEDWVVYTLDSQEIGIDIEYVRRIDFMDLLARFCSRAEQDTMHGCAPSMRLEFFYELWTLKESYVKAQGRGLSMPLDSFSVLIGGSGDIRVQTYTGEITPYSLRSYSIAPYYKLAEVLVAENPCVPIPSLV